MKRTIRFFLCFSLILLACLLLAACKKEPEIPENAISFDISEAKDGSVMAYLVPRAGSTDTAQRDTGLSFLSSLLPLDGGNDHKEDDAYDVIVMGKGRMHWDEEMPPWAKDYGHGIQHVEIHKGVSTVGDNAFNGCGNLETVKLPKDLESIGKDAFHGCDKLRGNVFGNLIYLDKGENPYGYLIRPVNRNITWCTIHRDTEQIPPYLFSACAKLVQVTNLSAGTPSDLPQNLHAEYRTSEDVPFANTLETDREGIVSYKVGDTVYYIDYVGKEKTLDLTGKGHNEIYPYAFTQTTLESVIVPDTVTRMGFGCFGTFPGAVEASRLKNLTIPFVGGAREDAQTGYIGYLFGVTRSDATPAPAGHIGTVTSLTITGGNIPDYSFFSCQLGNTDVTLGADVSHIGNMAFSYIGIRSLTFESKQLTCGTGAFVYSTIDDLYINDLTGWCHSEFGTFMGDSPIAQASRVYFNGQPCRELVIPQGVTRIGAGTFTGLRSMVSLTISEGVTAIGQRAFAECPNLYAIHFPASLQSMERNAFESSRKIQQVTNLSNITPQLMMDPTGGYPPTVEIRNSVDTPFSGTLVFGEGYVTYERDGVVKLIYVDLFEAEIDLSGAVITTMESGLFRRSACTSVVLPRGLTTLEDYMFAQCKQLVSITLPDTLTHVGAFAFSGCESLATIVLPQGVTSVGRDAFSWCKSLRYAELPDSLEGISDRTFFHCYALASVRMGKGILKIGEQAFDSCTELTSITLPNGLTEIGLSAFGWCKKLKSLTIPASVTRIGSGAFSATELERVVLENPTGWRINQGNTELLLGYQTPEAAAQNLTDRYAFACWTRE